MVRMSNMGEEVALYSGQIKWSALDEEVFKINSGI